MNQELSLSVPASQWTLTRPLLLSFHFSKASQKASPPIREKGTLMSNEKAYTLGDLRRLIEDLPDETRFVFIGENHNEHLIFPLKAKTGRAFLCDWSDYIVFQPETN